MRKNGISDEKKGLGRTLQISRKRTDRPEDAMQHKDTSSLSSYLSNLILAWTALSLLSHLSRIMNDGCGVVVSIFNS